MLKRIDELGISPWPWSAEIGDDDRFVIRDSEGYEIAQAFSVGYDSTIMSATPELYECLREAVEFIESHADSLGDNEDGDVARMVWGCNNALAKAAGEEVTHG